MEKNWEDALTSLKVGSSGGRPAVHKPLLVLMLIARAQSGKGNTVAYKDVADDLASAIQQFGGAKKANAALPFVHLQSEGFWKVREGEDEYKKSGKALKDAVGEVDARLWKELVSKPEMAKRVAKRLLEKYLPSDVRGQVTAKLGLKT
ncbi:MAG: hypothetical protein HS104_27015 [Polyangiaceae bacterium]|nr:hypothetical protein [Polyangiaceae bacterium]